MSEHTPGPWTAHRMVHEDTNKPMTPKQVGDYVRNSIKKSAKESGNTEFLIVTVEKPDGPADVCHVGNGPTSPANARLIAAAPDLLAKMQEIYSGMVCSCHLEGFVDGPVPCATCQIGSVIAKAEGR